MQGYWTLNSDIQESIACLVLRPLHDIWLYKLCNIVYFTTNVKVPRKTTVGTLREKKKMAAILDFRSVRFMLFLIYKSSQCFLPSFKSIGFLVQEKKQKINFQDGRQLGFLIETISALFDQQVTPSYQVTKFRVGWPFGSGEQAKKKKK